MKVLVIGKMASGKTTIANYLQSNHKFKVLSLAEPIKWMEAAIAKGELPYQVAKSYMPHLSAPEMLEFVGVLEEALLIPREQPKPRKRLQFIGTEGGRQRVRNDIWIEYADKRGSDYPNVVIDDVRFINEFEYFRSRGWKAIGLKVDAETQKQRILNVYGKYDPIVITHPSETGVDEILTKYPVDLIIDTSLTSVEEAGKTLDQFVQQWS